MVKYIQNYFYFLW